MLEDTKKFAHQIIQDPHFSAELKAAWQRVLDEIQKEEAKHDK